MIPRVTQRADVGAPASQQQSFPWLCLCLHVSSSPVKAREPDLSVLLYNENEELVHLPLVSSGLAELE